MTRFSMVAERWLGLCPKSPGLHTTTAIMPGSGFSQPVQPDGGAGGSGTIRRGIGSALYGMRILNRNRQLLWFALLAGLVLAGNIVSQGLLCYIRWISSDRIIPLVLDFAIEFATLFCLVLLLAGLVLSIAPERRGSVSFFAGLAGAKPYLKALVVWSFVLALAGMLLYRFLFFPVGFFWHLGSYLTIPLIQFPFTLNLNPSTFAEIPGYGGRSILFWTYPYGFENALTFSLINLLLFILTAFVVPCIVLGQKTLRDAVVGSFALLKKTWAEIAACALFLGVIVYGVFLTYLLIQAAHGMVTPPELMYAIPTGPWIALGLLYYLALFSIAFVVSTVGGIAVLDLYRFAKCRQMHGSPGIEASP
jgi:hypothetical protein